MNLGAVCECPINMKQQSKQMPKSCSVGMGFMEGLTRRYLKKKVVAMVQIRKKQRQSCILEAEAML